MTQQTPLASLIMHFKPLHFIKTYLDDDAIDIRQRVLTASIIVCVIGGVISLICSLLVDTNTTTTLFGNTITLPVSFPNLLIVFVLLFGVISIIYSLSKGTIQIPALLILVLINVVCLPLIFFSDGGIVGGVIPWYILCISLSPLVYRGNQRYIFYALGIVSFTVCLVISFLHPELVVLNKTELETYADVFQCTIIVALVISINYRLKTYAYDRQTKQLEDREKELETVVSETRKANEAKSAFLANMSHEIRTPINAVLGMNELILRENTVPAITRYAENIHRYGTSLLSTINDILDLTKIEYGKVELEPVEYYLSDVIADCFSMVSLRAAENNIRLRLDADKTMQDHFIGDVVRIRQIISNLMTNAVKYTPEGEVLMIVRGVVQRPGVAELTISVKDTGIGIREEDIPVLFDSFRRFDEKRNATIEGSGLGLTITKNILQLMGGTIHVASTPGTGSVFTAVFPQKLAAEKTVFGSRLTENGLKTMYVSNAADAQTYAPSFLRPDAVILAVDDVQVNLEVIKGFLKKTQIQIDTAVNGYEAIERIRERRYDLILLDDRMPGLTGIETLEKIRGEHLLAENVPVLMITANALIGAKERYIALGFTDFLSKPLRSRELESMVKKYLMQNVSGSTQSETVQTADFLVPAGIDKATAKLYSDSDAEMYRIFLQAYLQDLRLGRLASHFANKNASDYRTEIHGLKSASKTIGAIALSESAKALEDAAKEENWDYIAQHHEKTMADYKALLETIKAFLSEKDAHD